MSVSDVVVLHENGQDTAHFCDSIGFLEMPQFLHPEPALTAIVENAVTMETFGLEVEQHYGACHSIDPREIDGCEHFLMEHDEFGDEAACVVVDSTGKLAVQDGMDGFSPEVVAMIAQEALLDKMSAEQDAFRGSLLSLSPLEKNYDCIDERMSTQSRSTPEDDTGSQPELQAQPRYRKRPSVLVGWRKTG